MRYVEIYGFNGRENGEIARLMVVGFRFREKTYPHKAKRTKNKTNRGRIHERLQKNDGCKTTFVIFGTPDGNRIHN